MAGIREYWTNSLLTSGREVPPSLLTYYRYMDSAYKEVVYPEFVTHAVIYTTPKTMI